MIRVREVIVVEGKYDKNTLSQIIEGTIIETSGFGIFSDKEKMKLLRRMAEARGLVVLTDSDGAGFVIRNHIKGSIDGEYVKHAYIPEILGKERRKAVPSKEGTLGVEGMNADVILEALSRAGVVFDDGESCERSCQITKTDLFVLGLSGNAGSREKRSQLLTRLDLPQKLSPNALLDVLNALMSRDEFLAVFQQE